MENKIRQEEILAKPGMSKSNKLPLKKNPSRVIQQIETTNRYSLLETEDSPTQNKNARTDSPNKRNNCKTKQLIQLLTTYKIPTIKLKVIYRARGSSQLSSYLLILWFYR